MNASHYDHVKLKEFRERRFTQRELAEKLDVVEMTVSRAENGVSVSYELLLKICNLIGVDIREILKVEAAVPL